MCSISSEEGQGDVRRKQHKESLWGGKCMAQLGLAAAEGWGQSLQGQVEATF